MFKPIIIDHPLVHAKLARLRDRNTRPHDFRVLAKNLTSLMLYEAFRDTPTREVDIQTPLATAKGQVLADEICLVLVLRAGLGMMDGFLDLLPHASVGYIGLARNEETLQPDTYYCKLPRQIASTRVAMVDPMLATGGSAVAAINYLKQEGADRIKFICLLASPEGLDTLHKAHPDVQIYTAAVDEKINEKGYIVPGLGDAGDRLFGTE